jgi:uncharacterized membrane protein YfcA
MAQFLTVSFVIAAVTAVLAGVVRGFSGFGAAMIMTPVFVALYGPGQGISLCLLLEIVVALPLLPRAVCQVDWRRIGLLLMAAIAGAPLGTIVLTRVAREPLRWVISAIVLGAAGLLASGWRFRGSWRAPVTLAIGATSGFLNGLSGMAGPPIAFYYLAGTETVARVRANLTTYFILVDSIAFLVFVSGGLVQQSTAVLGLGLAPAVIAGGLLGQRLFPLASETFYRRLALGLLAGVAVGALIL